jgi:gamma-glutamylputrescine oxidase
VSEHIDSHYARRLSAATKRSPLTGAIEAEVCVVGGGLAGLATALELAERKHDVLLLEQHRIGWGASGRNGGFMSPGYQPGMRAVVDKVGVDQARELYELSRVGQRLILERIERYSIDCGPIVTGALRCAMAGRDEALPQYCDFMNETFGTELEHWPAERLRNALATSRYHDAFYNPHTRTLDPLRLADGYARAIEMSGGRIHEQTRVTAMRHAGGKTMLSTPHGRVTAANVVVACGGYVGWLKWPVSAATVPVATFVMVTEPLGNRLSAAISVPYAISDLKTPTNYYRPLPDGRLLWGGRVQAWQPGPERLAALLLRDLSSFYPGLADARAETAWGGFMGFLRHRMPVVAPIGPRMWGLTGFGGLGVTLTTTLGHLVAAAIIDGDDRWRLFAQFGLPFAGGTLGRIPAQLVYWRERLGARH